MEKYGSTKYFDTKAMDYVFCKDLYFSTQSGLIRF